MRNAGSSKPTSLVDTMVKKRAILRRMARSMRGWNFENAIVVTTVGR